VKTEKRTADGARATLYRDAPTWDGARTAALGDFRCNDAAAGAALLVGVADDLQAEGFQAVVGPMDGNTWNAYRLVA